MIAVFKKRILIVDDEQEVRQAIRRILMVSGKYIIEEAVDGFDAEKILKTYMPDLIILDVKMPGKDGYATCMHIRDDLRMKNVKIVGISGFSGGIGRSFMETLGADFYFEKPFDTNKLRERISKLLEDEN
ncbi:MAG: response regulator [Candidatus Omnitrophica bacterium]|nr:response regulator [Candidatus Omnitrophota bacterium]MBU1996734.1 response regulator [Candidatus Omnitrophota bacterium]